MLVSDKNWLFNDKKYSESGLGRQGKRNQNIYGIGSGNVKCSFRKRAMTCMQALVSCHLTDYGLSPTHRNTDSLK